MAEPTTSIGLFEPVLDRGVLNTHFFNGRLLTASDLKTEQVANRQQRQQLGRAIGAGIVQGLEVSLVADGSDGQPPIVSVTKGLALNRLGQVVELPLNITIRLARQPETLSPEGGLFVECQPPQEGSATPGAGVYVLVAAPTSGFREKAPRREFGQNGKVDGCGSRYAVEGVRFRLEELKISSLTGVSKDTRDAISTLIQEIDELRFRTDPVGVSQRRAKLSKLRNWLAHLCFGTETVAGFARDPFARISAQSPYLTYGALDALRTTGKLTDCDVPVALIYWTTQRVHFVDMWSVRRGPTPPPRSTTWPLPVGERSLVEGEAMFQQFQEQMDALLKSSLSQSDLTALQVTDYFRYLPPAGFLPVSRGALRGIDPSAFFTQPPHREPEFIDGFIVRALLDEALRYAPIDLAADELVWLYKPWQNAKAIDDGLSIQGYLIFTSGHMPHRAVARVDVARWNYSHYAD